MKEGKGAYGNIRDMVGGLRGQFRALTVWSAGSFAPGGNISIYKKLEKLNIRPEGGEKASRPLAHDKGKAFKQRSAKDWFLGAFYRNQLGKGVQND